MTDEVTETSANLKNTPVKADGSKIVYTGDPPQMLEALLHADEYYQRNGLYRGLSLNYLKTMPNVAIYMSLYDIGKLWLQRRTEQ